MSNRANNAGFECRIRRWCLLSLILLILFAPVSGWCRTVELTILHTTDLHGNIWPTEDYDGTKNLGGILRCASAIESIRQEKQNVLLIDCGDSYQGSPESYLTQGRLIIDAFNTLKYDAWVLGNHEFDWGAALLRARHDQVNIPFLAANLYFLPDSTDWLPKIQPYIIREVEGIRVAVIGLVTPGVPMWSRPNLLDNALFKGSVETLTELWPDVIAEEPDVIVVAAHQGYKQRGDDFANEIEAIAKSFPEVDVILGGHTHQAVHEMRYGDVLFAQAGYHGVWLGQVDLTYDTVAKAVTSKSGVLHLMDKRIPYHEKLLAKWTSDLNGAEATLTNVVGTIPHRLSSRPDKKGVSSMQQFLCRAISQNIDTDFVLHGSLNDQGIDEGEMTYRDVWRIVPYENTIGVLSLTPSQIRSVLEENYSHPLRQYTLGPYGFDYDLVSKDGFTQVQNLVDTNGVALHSRKKYKVAFNSYVLASGGERHMVVRRLADTPEAKLKMLPVDTRSLVVELLMSEKRERELVDAHAK